MQKPRAAIDKGRLRAAAKPYVTVYGYARVSTDGQSVDTQVRQLRAAGAAKVFREVASGAKTDRPQLRRLLSEVGAGDVMMVTRLDRLARSTRDLLKHARGDHRQESRLPITRRRMGRHHDGARSLDAHRLRRAGGVRARAYPHSHRRGPRARKGERSKPRPKTQAHPAPAARGDPAPRSRRIDPVDCPQLQFQPEHDFPPHRLTRPRHAADLRWRLHRILTSGMMCWSTMMVLSTEFSRQGAGRNGHERCEPRRADTAR
jgi:Resolvase, N terminal domain